MHLIYSMRLKKSNFIYRKNCRLTVNLTMQWAFVLGRSILDNPISGCSYHDGRNENCTHI